MQKSLVLLAGTVMGLGAAWLGLDASYLAPQPAQAAGDNTYRQINLFGDVLERIEAEYVDKPDEAKLVEAAIKGMLSSLDPHSSYMDAKSFGKMQSDMSGKIAGVGLEIMLEQGVIEVISSLAGGPAARAGITSGDHITHIDGKPVKSLSLEEAHKLMHGALKTQIALTVERKDLKEPFIVTLTREAIQIKAVHFRSENDIGYIQIARFAEKTAEELRSAIEDLKKEIGEDRLKGYVVDLRNDPGGVLDQAVGVCDSLMDRGEIVSIRGRNPQDIRRWDAHHGDITKGKPLVVLINGGSASASEIVAGALQDQKRATLIGTRSFGKGSVQSIMPIGNGAALRLTTGRYYTPSGRSIQAKGIEPDIKVLEAVPDDLKDMDEALGEANLPGHLTNAKGEDVSGSQAYVASDPDQDTQLIAAFDFLHGKKLPATEAASSATEKPAAKQN
jgi:carboxyl-terminal processing protease